MPAKVLIVDDEPSILATMAPLLRTRGYEVSTAMSGLGAVESVERDKPDVIVLDLGLPDIDGFEVCRLVREHSTTPIVVLSARGAEGDKVRALDAGADDYVTKPFGVEELIARIRAALRRSDSHAPTSEPIVRGTLVIDRERFRVLRDGEEVRLTPKEFELLVYLAQRAGRVLTHRSLLKAIWGPHAVDQPEHLRVLIGSLRKKIEPTPSSPRYILTEPWVGYRFADI
ncbi:MAG: response regulator transcription factor [Vicinamibacterales bacterium]